MEKFRITIGSFPDKENLVADIFYKDVQWAEITQETNELIIQFYPHPRQSHWEFVFEEALEALEKAKKQMLGLGGIRSD